MTFQGFIVSILAVLFSWISSSCATTPITNRRQIMLVSADQMNQLGEQAFGEIKQKEQPWNNEAVRNFVVKVGTDVAKASERNLDWEFALFRSPQENAFALPGGKVGVYAGILPIAQDNAGLAAILAHEIGHAIARHGAERVSQALVVEGVMIGVDAAMRDDQKRPMILAAMGLGAQVGVMLPFSRKQEKEADRIGMILMAKAGYDPAAAIGVWERMEKRAKSNPPEFLSTHPHPKSRIRNLKRYLGDAKKLYEAAPRQAVQPIPLKEVASQP